MGIVYAIVLVIRVAAFPWMIPIHFDTFETEPECRAAAVELDKSTTVELILSCEINT